MKRNHPWRRLGVIFALLHRRRRRARANSAAHRLGVFAIIAAVAGVVFALVPAVTSGASSPARATQSAGVITPMEQPEALGSSTIIANSQCAGCTMIRVSATYFGAGNHTVTFHAYGQDGVKHYGTGYFTGDNGAPYIMWTDLGIDITNSGRVTWWVTWNKGANSSGYFGFNPANCLINNTVPPTRPPAATLPPDSTPITLGATTLPPDTTPPATPPPADTTPATPPPADTTPVTDVATTATVPPTTATPDTAAPTSAPVVTDTAAPTTAAPITAPPDTGVVVTDVATTAPPATTTTVLPARPTQTTARPKPRPAPVHPAKAGPDSYKNAGVIGVLIFAILAAMWTAYRLLIPKRKRTLVETPTD